MKDQAYPGRTRRSFAIRFIILGIFFAVVCMVYTARLIRLQLGDSETFFEYSEDDLISYTVVVKGDRGAICDRNGNVLAGNSEAYNLNFNYDTMASDNAGINDMILRSLLALQETGNMEKLAANSFPYAGIYPSYTPLADLSNPDSAVSIRLEKFIINRELGENASQSLILETMLKKYGLVDREGKTIYGDYETHCLLTVRYDMESKNFNALNPYTVAERVDMRLMAAMKEMPVTGAEIVQRTERVYPYPGYASHILGRISKIYAEDWEYYNELGYAMDAMVGISGCEMAFEEQLRGTDGLMKVYVDSRGDIVRTEMIQEPKRGSDVWLTIDIGLQMVAEDTLAQNVAKIVASATGENTGEDCNAGAVVAADPKNGELLAIASFPTFDLTTYNENYDVLYTDADLPLFNRALEGTYAPGSTFKLGVAIAALEEGIVTPSTLIETKGIYRYFNSYQPRCWIYTSTGRSHGSINVVKAIEVSCNYYFYDVGRILGIDALNRYCTMYGLGEKTGVELPEAVGVLAGPAWRDAAGYAEWSEIDTLAASIGQSDNLFTPIQICQYTAAITNGTRYAAHLFYRTVDYGTGEIMEEAVPKVLGTLSFTSTTVSALRQGMRQVITASSTLSRNFRPLDQLGVTVGGKTGTAQVFETDSDNGIFTCVAPLDDPEIAISCVIERAGGGSYVAMTPAAMMEYYFTSMAETAVAEP
jgi:penicillin-binding protein 2